MATITVQSLETTGLTFAFSTASTTLTDQFANDGETVLYIKNGAAATNQVVIASQFDPVPKGLVKTNITVNMAGTQEKMCGPFEQAIWNDANGYVQLTFATHTSLYFAAISLNT